MGARKKTTGARLWWTVGGASAGGELASSVRTSWHRESSRGGPKERDDGGGVMARLGEVNTGVGRRMVRGGAPSSLAALARRRAQGRGGDL